MPRPKAAVVSTFAPGPGPEACGELTASIDALITVANEWPVDNPRTSVLFDWLSALARGEHVYPPRSWPLEVAVALDNLASNVLSGRWHLRRCPHCERLFVARNRRRLRCYRDGCAKAATRTRVRRAREHERARQASTPVTRTGTKRTG
jgi:hypothetical protein